MITHMRALWRLILHAADPDQAVFVDTCQLTTAHPTRLTEIEQRAAADAEAKVLRVSGKNCQCHATIPAVSERKR